MTRLFSRRLALLAHDDLGRPSMKLGIGAWYDPTGGALGSPVPGAPGSETAPLTVQVSGPVEISNPVWNAMSLVVGIATGYALGKVT